MNVVEVLLAGGKDPDKPALITEESRHSWAELRQRVHQMASFLAERGVRKGEPVGLLTETSLFAIAAYLGILRAGAVAVPISTTVSPEHLSAILEQSAMRVLFVQGKALEDAAPLLRTLETLVVDKPRPDLALEGPERVELDAIFGAPLEVDAGFAQVAESDLALLMFTSGSTRQPRGVMLTHGNVLANLKSILGYLPLEASDRVMLVLPFYYSFGASVLHTHLAVGATVVIDKRFMHPDKVLRRMQELECTGFCGVPSHYQILLRRSQLKTTPLPSLRWMQQAGGKLAASFVEELRALLPQVKLYLMYGSTEATARIAYLPPERIADKPGSVGHAIPGVVIHLLDEAGQPVPPGAVGEIVVEGPNVSQGYFRAPEETAEAFRQGRLHTGDLARRDQEGFLYVVDRARDFIKTGGTRTSSKAIEEALLRFPELVECAVIGIADDTLGEAVAAFVVPRDGSDPGLPERLRAFAQEALPAPQVPKLVKLLPALPKNSSGKVMKVQLRSLL